LELKFATNIHPPIQETTDRKGAWMNQQNMYTDVIQFAIGNEQGAVDLYSGLADRTENPARKILFSELADMERGHKVRLQKLDVNYFASQELKSPEDLKISDYLVHVELKPDSSYQEVLLYAAKSEKAAFDLYTDLAGLYLSTPEVRKMFLVLAQEEAYHKLKLEREYDENVYQEC
jgi:rubrerythrin